MVQQSCLKKSGAPTNLHCSGPAKNSLQIVAGFSACQMVLGKNLNLPYSTMEDLSPLSMKSTLCIIQESINAIYRAGATFIASKNNAEIHRPLL